MPKAQPSTQSLFDDLQAAAIDMDFYPALLVKSIIPPADSIEPTAELAADIARIGVQVPLLVRTTNRSSRYQIISGRRRYRAAVLGGIETVPALITSADDTTAALFAVKLDALRTSNLLAEMKAINLLAGKGLTDSEIDKLTGLSAQERKQRLLLLAADSRIGPALVKGQLTMARALQIAKLPPKAQAALLDKLNEEGVKRITTADVSEVRTARRAEAVALLPDEMFTTGNDATFTPEEPQAVSVSSAAEEVLHRCALTLYHALEELRTSGALDGKNNKLATRARADALHILAGVNSQLDEQGGLK